MQIAPAASEHCAAIAEIYNDAVVSSTATFDTEPRTERQIVDWLALHDARHPVLVAVDGAAVVAWASLSRWSDRPAYDGTAEISIYVEQGRRGQGIGGRLMEQLLAAGREARLHTVLARIAGDNEPSVRLHERAGFRLVGTMSEVGYKFGRYIDVRLMQLLLARS